MISGIGSSLVSNLFWTSSSIFLSSPQVTKIMTNPLVPNNNPQRSYFNFSNTVKLENQIDCVANVTLSNITFHNYSNHFTKYVGQMKDSQDEDAYELDSFQLNYNQFNDSDIKKSLEQETQTLKQTMGRYIKHTLLYWIVRYWLESS